MNRQDYIGQITDALAILSRKVEIRASLNLTDINVCAEDFYKDLLNLAFGYKLRNLNESKPNAKAIDLFDSENRIAIQVTSTSAIVKTRKTVTKFIEKELYRDYDRLVILNLVRVTPHKEKSIGITGIFQIDTKQDIWDYNDLARKISSKDSATLKNIADFLHKELKLIPDSKLPKEVQTIIALIDHLSNCIYTATDEIFIEEPDPEGKIYKRFAEHSGFLTQTYSELYNVYISNLETVKEMTDIGTVQVAKMALYLKTYSDKVLTESDGNPKVALDKITQEFARIVGQKGIEYDETAITFFLVNELIRCNVFPKNEAING